MNEEEKLKIELLIKECESTGQAIRTMLLTNEKVMALGFTIISTGLVYGIKEKVSEILLFLPLAVFAVLFYGIRITAEIMSLGGYKRYLEENINSILRENVLLWESFIAPKMHRSFVLLLLYIVYTFFILLVVFISLQTIWRYYTKETFWFMVIFLLSLSICLIISLSNLYKAFDTTYQIAKEKSKIK